jgi:molybdate transport system permease protein
VNARIGKSPLAWLGALIVLYLGVPMAAFVVRFVTVPQRGFHVPGLYPALWTSVSCATVSLILASAFGVPLAYVLARSRGRFASIVGLIVQIPLALPPLMSGIVLVYIIGPYTFLGRLFGQHLTESDAGIVIAMTFVAAPFLIVSARAAFSSVPQDLLDVAATLGHHESSRFLRVAVPVAGPGIRAGMLMAWLRAFGEYGAVIVLAYNPTSLPVYAYKQFSGRGLPTTLAPTALAMGVAVIAVLISRLRIKGAPKGVGNFSEPRAPANAATEPVRFEVDHHRGEFHLSLANLSEGKHLAVLGPSGAGKSNLLRCLAGLYGAGPGKVWYGDQLVQDVPVEKRRVGYVAQGFSLFPHLTVGKNLLFATNSTPELATYWLSRLGLEGLQDRYPSEISGGQRQRVALAQVLCSSPRVLLLDEPFSSLDVPVRIELRRELRRLQHETGLATVLVTHDAEEAAFLSDEVIVISNGRALQSGSSRHVFSRPASPEVASLLGIANLHHANVVSPTLIDAQGALVTTNITDYSPGQSVLWSIRPERVRVVSTNDLAHSLSDGAGATLIGTVVDIADVGTAFDLFIAVAPDLEIQARTTELIDYALGDHCRIELPVDAISLWPTPWSHSNSGDANSPTAH